MDSWLVVFVAVQLAFYAFLLWLAASYRQKSLNRRSEERLRVLERFSSGQELSDFLATEHGGRFLEQLAVKPKNPAGLIVGGVVCGILTAAVGGAFLLLIGRGDNDFLIPAAFVLSVAFGILAATLISFLLARKLGLLPPIQDRDADRRGRLSTSSRAT